MAVARSPIGVPGPNTATNTGVLYALVAVNGPPVCDANGPYVAECGVATTLDGTGSVDPEGQMPLTFTWTGPFTESPASGSTPTVTFPAPAGVKSVNLLVVDPDGLSEACTAQVTVQDTIAPNFELVLTPNELWPPNHKLVSIEADIQMLTDVCDAAFTIRLVSITSNEPDNGLGDGDTPGDIQEADFSQDDRTFLLRAERSGRGSGRVYTITYVAEDASGNQTSKQATVTVPHR